MTDKCGATDERGAREESGAIDECAAADERGAASRRSTADTRALPYIAVEELTSHSRADRNCLRAHACAWAGLASGGSGRLNSLSSRLVLASASFSVNSPPSHLATTDAAMELPTALVADRPMSRNVSTPRISSKPASGMLNWLSVAAITTSDARGTPAMPLDVSIRMAIMVSCVEIGRSML